MITPEQIAEKVIPISGSECMRARVNKQALRRMLVGYINELLQERDKERSAKEVQPSKPPKA